MALDLTAAALSEWRPVPVEAVGLMAKSPVPFLLLTLWRSIYARLGGEGFEREAARNGRSGDRLLDQHSAA